MSEYSVRHGGLMRCCLASLDKYLESLAAAAEDPVIGTVVNCLYCKDPTMVLAKDGVWEWVGPKE